MTRMIGPAVSRGAKTKTDTGRRVVEGQVLTEDDALYRGRFGASSPLWGKNGAETGKKNAKDWQDVHDKRDRVHRQVRETGQMNDRYDREAGKHAVGLTAALGGTLVASGELSRTVQERQNAKLRRQVGKSFAREDPLLWHAEKEGSAHKVTLMGEKDKAEQRLKPPESKKALNRIGRFVTKKPEAAALTLLGAGTAIGVPSTLRAQRAADENEQLKTQLRRKQAAQRRMKVAKARNPLGPQPYREEAFVVKPRPEKLPPEREWDGGRASHDKRQAEARLKHDAKEKVATTPRGGPWTGKPISGHWRDHVARGQVRNAATSALLAGAVGGGVLVSQRRKKDVAKSDTRRNLETAGGAVAGAATMDALNTVGGQSAKAVLKERRNRRGTTPREEAAWGAHKQKMMGLKPGEKIPTDDSIPQSVKAKTFLRYPKGMPDWRAHRALGFKNTKGWTAGSLAGSALVGGAAARRRGEVDKSAGDIPRAAARAGRKGAKRTKPTEEEIAALRAAKGRTGEPKPAQQAAAPAGPPPPAPERPRSSFLGRGQIRDLAIGVPLGTGALAYSLRPQREVRKADTRRRDTALTAGAGLGAAGAHAAESRGLKLSERELSRVISANNADGVGEGDFHPDQPRIDRGKHARRAVSQLDNVRLARGAKLAFIGSGLVTGRKLVEKRDRRDTAERVGAGAVGGAALLDAGDTVLGAGLKRIAVNQRDRAKRTLTADQIKANNTIMREHGEKHGLVDDRGRGRAPKPGDPHKAKNAYYRGYPTAIPGGRVQRINAMRDKKTGPILATGAALGGLAGLRSSRVEKGLSVKQVGALTGTGSLASVATSRRHGASEEAKEAAGATVGGWAGQGAYQGAGYGYRNSVRGPGGSKVPRHELPHLKPDEENFPDPKERAKRKQNAREREQLNRHHPRKADQKRNTPPHWHGSRMERRLGYTHGGKTGTALGTAATLAGALVGAEAASSKKRPLQKPAQVKKAFRPEPPLRGVPLGRRTPKQIMQGAAGPGKDTRIIRRAPDIPLERGAMRSRERDSFPATTPAHERQKAMLKLSTRRAKDLELPGGGVMRAGNRRVFQTQLQGYPDDMFGRFEVGKRATPVRPLRVRRTKKLDVNLPAPTEPNYIIEYRRKQAVGKSVEWGYREKRRSKFRTAEMATGAGLGAWGASRLQVGPSVKRGVKYAEAKGYGVEARGAANLARRGRNQVRRVTGQAENVLRGRVPGFGSALDKIPVKMRPGAALGAGALLAARAHPVHDERFVSTGRF